MNKNTGIILGVIALVVIVGGIYLSKNSNKDDVVVTAGKAMMEQQSMQGKEMVIKDDVGMMKKEDTMMKTGSYEAYSPEKIMMASTTYDVVLFFRASWCPSCIGLDKDIKANLEKIPSSLTILDVNYDNSKDLKQKYSVTYQHTFVQVDKDGTMIKKWSGSPTLSALVSEVK